MSISGSQTNTPQPKITSGAGGTLPAAISGPSTPQATPIPGTSGGSINTVDVTEGSYYIKLSHNTVQPGQVTFNVTNQGPDDHEFVIFKTQLAQDNLPTQKGQIDENASSVTKIEDHAQVPKGTSYTVSVNLQPGHYVVVCNLPGHYLQGMHAELVVSQNAAATLTAEGGSTSAATPTPKGAGQTPSATPTSSGPSATPTMTATAAATSATTAGVPATGGTAAPTQAATSGTPEVTPTLSANATKVNVVEKSYTIFIGKSVIPAGQVQFQLSTEANMQHEFVVFQTDLAANNLSVQNGQVVETSPQLNKMGEQDQYPGGESRTLTLTLQPSHYVAICNIVGHYQQGMHIDFWVTSGGALLSIPSAGSAPSSGG